MHAELYLDTARLGRMCRGARLAEQDFCWLVSQLGSPLYLERFLTHGFQSLPPRLRNRVTGLRYWRGMQQLADSLGQFIQQRPELPSYFFAQSSDMIRFAAESLLSVARRILVTDLCWPPYLHALQQTATDFNGEICLVRLNAMVTSQLASSDDIVDHLQQVYYSNGCDGLFLSDINYLGVRLPVERLIARLQPRFAVLDGAQAFHQRHVDLSKLGCDLYLTGTQKWFGAFQPLRIVFTGRGANEAVIRRSARALCNRTHCDALFRFHEEVKSSSFPPFGTTVNVSPLICAASALRDAERQAESHHDHWQVLRTNAEVFSHWSVDSRWRPVRLHPSLSSGIVRLVCPEESPIHVRGGPRQALAQQGIVATAYEDGSLRFSMPRSYLSLQQLSRVSVAISRLLVNSRRCVPYSLCQSTASPPVRNPSNVSRVEPSGAVHHP